MSDHCLKEDCHCQPIRDQRDKAEKEATRYKKALELLTYDQLTVPFYIQDNQEGRELRAKYQYGHGVLKEGKPGRCIGHSAGEDCFCFGEKRNPAEGLGKFGHHPDAATDFCVEVDAIEGMVADCKAGLESRGDLNERIFRAMEFRVGGEGRAVMAKGRLREIKGSSEVRHVADSESS